MFHGKKNQTLLFFNYELTCQLQADSILGVVYALLVTPAAGHQFINKSSFARSCRVPV